MKIDSEIWSFFIIACIIEQVILHNRTINFEWSIEIEDNRWQLDTQLTYTVWSVCVIIVQIHVVTSMQHWLMFNWWPSSPAIPGTAICLPSPPPQMPTLISVTDLQSLSVSGTKRWMANSWHLCLCLSHCWTCHTNPAPQSHSSFLSCWD